LARHSASRCALRRTSPRLQRSSLAWGGPGMADSYSGPSELEQFRDFLLPLGEFAMMFPRVDVMSLGAQFTDERRNPVASCLRENKRHQEAGIEIEHFLYRASYRSSSRAWRSNWALGRRRRGIVARNAARSSSGSGRLGRAADRIRATARPWRVTSTSSPASTLSSSSLKRVLLEPD
jgi:hypothetical protein